jgi:FlaA1/EpsC-like NDP-sugar epimerase
MGTRNIVLISKKYQVSKFILISTDKAVRPVNVMGMTKQVAECIVQEAAAATRHPYVTVRFGNVLGSRGSVIPRFKSQIEAGGPVTVTHPEVDRYFMTIPEAVQLVLQAASLGRNGEVFILDMGEPVNIADLAKDMIRLSGLQEGRDIQIKFTGLRPGERLHEELFTEEENCTRTVHEKILVAQHSTSSCQQPLDQEIEVLQKLAGAGKEEELLRKLRAITQHNTTNAYPDQVDVVLEDLIS